MPIIEQVNKVENKRIDQRKTGEGSTKTNKTRPTIKVIYKIASNLPLLQRGVLGT